MSASPGARRLWLVGPLPDLLFGCGLGYALLLGVLAAVRPDLRRLQALLPLLILVTGIPHYGATLLRAYGCADSRRRHAFHGFLLSGLVWLAFAAAVYQPSLGSLLITLYLSWSPWHYGAQNYGLTSMFLGRGGVRLSPSARRLLFVSFALSVALTLTNYHRVFSVGSGDPTFGTGRAYGFVPIGIPEGVVGMIFPVLALGYAATLVALAWRLRALGRATRLPVAALLLLQALWFAVPAAIAHFGRPGLLESLGASTAFVWIAVGHSVQYLWVSRHFDRAGGAHPASNRLWGLRVLCAGAIIWVVPALLFAPGVLGSVPFDAGLGLLVAAAVNLHHFVLDSAIWKLRDPAVGQVLVGGTAQPALGQRFRDGPADDWRRPRLGRTLVLGLGAVSVFCWIATAWEKEVGHRRAYLAGDLPRLRLASERLRLLGRDGPRLHLSLARLEERRGRPEAALQEYRKSVALEPTTGALMALGRLSLARGDQVAADEAYQAAFALPGPEPDPGAADAGYLARPSERR